MKLQYRIGSAIASTALLFATLAPAAYADTTVLIDGNGAKSDNKVEISNTKEVNVDQKNKLDVTLNINSTASTGGNKANGNTGGNVDVNTGDATTETGVLIIAGSNKATVSSCGCDADSDVTISDNGRRSKNKVELKKKDELNVKQKNDADIVGNIDSKAKTGKNKANDNTGGDTKVKTGKSVTTTGVAVISGSNKLN